jgi:2-polyprenyl-3-methyl-5-hydroxy-6-metoxy-1,4-benzoquinol methylase
MSTELSSFRLTAAKASGGTASDPIYKTVQETLSNQSARGRLLDLGAGRGNLTRRLKASDQFASLTGVDIVERPTDLPSDIAWVKADLNEPLPVSAGTYDTVVCSEVIEHVENPRALVREIYRLLAPDGLVVLSTPNCENIRSFISLAVRGHHWAFGPSSYPAHLTALTRLDLERCFIEAGLIPLSWTYTNKGGIPGRPVLTWQQVSFCLLRGLRFSDNVVIAGRKMTRTSENVAPPRPSA